MKKLILIVGLFLFGGLRSAFAGPILSDLPADAYITYGGLDWAWVSPVVTHDWFSANQLSDPGLHDGWRFATAAEWAARPDASAFLALPDIAAAVPYWNSAFTHIDYLDAVNGFVQSGFTEGSSNEMWYVRDASSSVPDSGSAIAMLGLGLAALAAFRRRLA